ncbi:phospholipase D-like domain-containing protein [Curtobacterium sp. MCBD17_040]|uniref:phospholipase D-like domain-containing protein n=1 Tax=Curtobacterium sp. MCBD17_040 TaxID=2175674 RepID=UPI0011B73C0F|nr:phospholipase D-like domain-containing protein [Curtobacterium sp. MCBD17_040]WIB65773.1 phospholipase D-like domain-containing protein [Curtobacterium sp. MCBD17_040]
MKKRRSAGSKVLSVVVAVAVAGVLATATGHHFDVFGVRVTLPTAHAAPAAASARPATTSTPAAASNVGGAGEYQLMQEPHAGFQPIYALLTGAKTSIDMTMYELEDQTATADLVAAQHRGVRVRVLLDKDFSGARANAAAYQTLTAAGVAVQWAPAGFIFHQKTITVDGAVSAVGTANLTAQYYATTRDAWVIDRNPSQVAAIEQTFTADLADPDRPGTATQTPGLLWSPGAEQTMVAAIDDAKTSIDFESEELADRDVITALEQAARRGVTCNIVMTRSSDWTTAFNAVTAAGCHVRTYPDSDSALYIHEKALLTDRSNLIIGSQNAGDYSLTRNRELSLILTSSDAPAVVNSTAATFAKDYAAATAWQ